MDQGALLPPLLVPQAASRAATESHSVGAAGPATPRCTQHVPAGPDVRGLKANGTSRLSWRISPPCATPNGPGTPTDQRVRCRLLLGLLSQQPTTSALTESHTFRHGVPDGSRPSGPTGSDQGERSRSVHGEPGRSESVAVAVAVTSPDGDSEPSVRHRASIGASRVRSRDATGNLREMRCHHGPGRRERHHHGRRDRCRPPAPPPARLPGSAPAPAGQPLVLRLHDLWLRRTPHPGPPCPRLDHPELARGPTHPLTIGNNLSTTPPIRRRRGVSSGGGRAGRWRGPSRWWRGCRASGSVRAPTGGTGGPPTATG